MQFVPDIREWLLKDLERELRTLTASEILARLPEHPPHVQYFDFNRIAESLGINLEDQVKVPFSPLSQPNKDLCQEALDTIADIVRTGDFTLGGAVKEFEDEFQKWSGGHVVAVNSGTDALKLSLLAAGVGRDDKVIVPAHTFIATIGAVMEIGARPVIVDVDPWTGLISAEAMAHALENQIKDTKAVIPVWWAGACPSMDVFNLADSWKLKIIEDACQAFGCKNDTGGKAGSLGDFGAFSLHPLKNIHVWGDGGVIVCRELEDANRLRLIRNHGLADRDTVACFGVNSRLDSVQAAVGLATLGRAQAMIERRRAMAYSYRRNLQATDYAPCHGEGPVHLFQIRVPREKRDALLEHLQANGVEAKVHYPVPLPYQPCFNGHYKPGDFPGAEEFCASHITLPLHDNLTTEHKIHMFKALRSVRAQRIVPDGKDQTAGQIQDSIAFDEILPMPADTAQAKRYLMQAVDNYTMVSSREQAVKNYVEDSSR